MPDPAAEPPLPAPEQPTLPPPAASGPEAVTLPPTESTAPAIAVVPQPPGYEILAEPVWARRATSTP
jgi:hypothetical protein